MFCFHFHSSNVSFVPHEKFRFTQKTFFFPQHYSYNSFQKPGEKINFKFILHVKFSALTCNPKLYRWTVEKSLIRKFIVLFLISLLEFVPFWWCGRRERGIKVKERENVFKFQLCSFFSSFEASNVYIALHSESSMAGLNFDWEHRKISNPRWVMQMDVVNPSPIIFSCTSR